MDAHHKLVGLYSPVMQSGKSTVAEYLDTHHNYVRKSFATPIKEMIRTFLMCAGYQIGVVDRMIAGDLKEATCISVDISPRYLMQTLGTEWGRKLIKDDLWVHIGMAVAWKTINTSHLPVVFDDVRFPNEAEAIKEAGGTLIQIVRPGKHITIGHQSEGALNDYAFDYTIINNGTVEDLHKKVYDCLFNKDFEHA